MMFALKTCAECITDIATNFSPTHQLSLVPKDIHSLSYPPCGSVLIAVANERSVFNPLAWSVKHPWLVNANKDPDVFIITPTPWTSIVVDTNKESGLRTITTNNEWIHITYSIPLTKTLIISYTNEFLRESVYNVVPISTDPPVPMPVPVSSDQPAPMIVPVLPRDDDDIYGESLEALIHMQGLFNEVRQMTSKISQELLKQKNVVSVDVESSDDAADDDTPSEHTTVSQINEFVDEMTGVTVTDPPDTVQSNTPIQSGQVNISI